MAKVRKSYVAAAVFATGVGAFRWYAKWRHRRIGNEQKRSIVRSPIEQNKKLTVVVHGLGGSAYQIDTMLLPYLERQIEGNVVAIDQPGHGGAKPLPESERTIPQQAEWLREALTEEMDRFGVEECNLIGISLGGEISMRYVIEESLREEWDSWVKRLVLFEPPYRGKYAPFWHRALFWLVFKAYLGARPLLNAEAEALAIELVGRFSRRTGGVEQDTSKEFRPKRLREVYEHCSRINEQGLDWPSWVWAVYAILTYDGASVIEFYPTDVPVLLIGGKDTTDEVVRTVEALAHELPNGADVEVAWMDGAHKITYRDPEEFAKIIGEWMARK